MFDLLPSAVVGFEFMPSLVWYVLVCSVALFFLFTRFGFHSGSTVQLLLSSYLRFVMSIDIDLFPFSLRFAILHITHVLFSLHYFFHLFYFTVYVFLHTFFHYCSYSLIVHWLVQFASNTLCYCSFTFTTIIWVLFYFFV